MELMKMEVILHMQHANEFIPVKMHTEIMPL